MESPPTEPVWCVIANVLSVRPYGVGRLEIRRGTKHFSPGTKVYIRHAFWGMGGEAVEVVARHRGTKRFVVMSIRTAWLQRFRVKLAYSPRVVSLLIAKPGQDRAPERGDGYYRWSGNNSCEALAHEWARQLREVAEHRRSRWPAHLRDSASGEGSVDQS